MASFTFIKGNQKPIIKTRYKKLSYTCTEEVIKPT
uniref:Uncharacterized protein n=1 Tax=Anguilla anguilla TaxID=7936 RepID=A0A0E9XDW6_ANGAN